MKSLMEEQIKEIAEQLICGFKCFWNKENGELISIPEGLEIFDLDPDEGWTEELEKLDNNPDDFAEIEKPNSRESFKSMVGFTETLSDSSSLKKRLVFALENKKPFREFKFLIDNSGDARQMWFDFRDKWMEDWVRERGEEIIAEEEEN